MNTIHRAAVMFSAVAAFSLPSGAACAADARAGVKSKADGAATTHRYPLRPVRFIVPFPPAGGTDIVGRLLAQRLTERLGQQFVIDNRPGAASTIGANIAAQAQGDGYTLLLVTASYAISATYYKNLPYDPVQAFAPVSLVAAGPLLLVVHPAVAAASVQELIALAKGAPGKLNYASGGAGGINHLAGEMFKAITGTQLVHVPYKGAGPALTGVIAGEAQLMVATLGSSLRHVKSGKLKALAVGGERRTRTAPDLPTVSESGVPGYAAENWYGVLVPRGAPGTVISMLNEEISAALRRDDIRAQFVKLGFEPMGSTPDEFGAHLKREIEKWARVMKTAGVTYPR
ncbi:MAG TPA: tripartite tricarboxylate transporter substrate binding protein [Burkholderiales bacterium]|nr:tripartite tricarboxylate transporter substrate binding protein [Burkholderiales bacterium]